jgi:predicted GIY-YIG superfamily endonuclease
MRTRPASMDFYGVYLLRSVHAPRRGYIGVTHDLPQRLRAHNGLRAGGAAATRLCRPWEVYAHVTGFSSKHAALCFEFAWQFPQKVGRAFQHPFLVRSMKSAYQELRGITSAWVRGEDSVAWNVRVLQAMLEIELWKGMGLAVRYAPSKDAERAVVEGALGAHGKNDAGGGAVLPAGSQLGAAASAACGGRSGSKRKADDSTVIPSVSSKCDNEEAAIVVE